MFRILLLFLCLSKLTKCKDLPQTCDSPVYCYGDLLRTVQLAGIFKDSSTFVNLKMVNKEGTTLKNFKKLKSETKGKPTRAQIVKFVRENFEKGNEMETSELTDFNPKPSFLNEITNKTIKKFASELVQIWPKLARKVKREVVENIEHYSFIPVPKTFILAGAHFTEYFYWDHVWILDGLLLCGMTTTARDMIDNHLYLVNRYGHVPNGGRIYRSRRSQLPILTPMAFQYFQTTNDTEWLKKSINTLVKELEYWNTKTINVKKGSTTHTFYHYGAQTLGPRPEMYKEDVRIASYFKDERKRQKVYSELKGGSESGMQFSSRWIFDQNGGNNANLSHVETSRVIPVDLNGLLCEIFNYLSQLYEILGNDSESSKWKVKYLKMAKSFDEVLWNEEYKIWFDYDVKLSKHRKYFYATNGVPLRTLCFNQTRATEFAQNALKYLKFTKVLDYPGGIPASLSDTGYEWDFPNALAPLQYILILGLASTNYKPAQDQAEILAKRWVDANLMGFNKYGIMFDKYSALKPGEYGTGEYDRQVGFGWTNGIALRFIYDYYRK